MAIGEYTESTDSKLISEEDSIYTKILNDIARGKLVSGDRLVTTQLAKQYNTSINPVREALKQLQGEGFVTVLANSGSRVTKFEFHTMRDVFEILALLEPYLMEWFINEHTDEQLDTLKIILKQMTDLSPSDFVRYRELDAEFHASMYSHHYNKRAYGMWCKNRLMLQAFHANLGFSVRRFEQSLVEHQDLLTGIENRNVDAVMTTLNKHIDNSGQYWSKHFQ
ncbi:GntR family transcriptional regulator [Paraglaciecola aquimarina]|uniref:GntR family transcriptional regulator n=1 Tax=Paraglaciecola algarum TaxID=3050085 RepID=A0ABS9D2H8_9ALTE|nr:GntR family transcriptional regulator [Paraglaciecola sp. G1-23]MCF2947128.1 GntR family transcriptional regulator [Paraglaciecola sp. G1-23]